MSTDQRERDEKTIGPNHPDAHRFNSIEPVTRAHRVPVTFRWDGLNWDFIKMMAEIAFYAGKKYGQGNPNGLSNYTEPRLRGEKGPVNHMYEHLKDYQTGKPHDHFGNPVFHLVAIAYNAMMEAYYLARYGMEKNPLTLEPTQQEVPAYDDIPADLRLNREQLPDKRKDNYGNFERGSE